MNVWIIVALYWIVCCVLVYVLESVNRTSGLSQNDAAKDWLLGAPSAHRLV